LRRSSCSFDTTSEKQASGATGLRGRPAPLSTLRPQPPTLRASSEYPPGSSCSAQSAIMPGTPWPLPSDSLAGRCCGSASRDLR
jgi:hypothetical protein